MKKVICKKNKIDLIKLFKNVFFQKYGHLVDIPSMDICVKNTLYVGDKETGGGRAH